MARAHQRAIDAVSPCCLDALPFLRGRVLSTIRQEAVGQIGQDFKCPRQSLPLFAQHDFVAAAEDFHLLALHLELLRQPDGLTVAGTKNPGSRHCCTSSPAYTAM
jgi:hypothetical protein